MATIGLDIDGVIYNFVDQLRNYICIKTDKTPKDLPSAQCWDFFRDQWGFSISQYHEFVKEGVRDGYIFWTGEMYEDCEWVMNYLYRIRGDDLILITARTYPGLEKLCKAATEYWLGNEAGLPYTELIVLGYDGLKHLHKVDVLFDDAPHHIENAILNGQNAVLFDQPWNHHMTYAERVHGWKGIKEYVDEHFPRNVIQKKQEMS